MTGLWNMGIRSIRRHRHRLWFVAAVIVAFLAASLTLPMAGRSAPAGETKVALTADVGSMDPYKDNSVVGLEIQGHLYDALVDYRGPRLTVTPLVAQRWQNVDPTTWRFFLRKGVKFHNGRELTAEDVKFSFDLAKQSPTARAKVANVTDVRIVDPYTIDVKTVGPSASLLANLTFIFILPKAEYESRGADAFGQQPIGSGPYRLESWDKGQQIVLTAFPGYWGGSAKPARIVIRPIPEASTRLAELLTGGVDVIQDLPVENVQQVRQNKSLAVVQAKGIRQIFFPINVKADTPLKDRRVRQAMNFAIDREKIVRDILEGFAEARTGPWGPGQMGFNAEAAKFYQYNPEKAKALLREAGYPDGFALTWNLCKGCWLKDSEVLEAIANQFRAVGIKMTIKLLEVNQLFSDQNAANFQIGMIRWSRQYDTDTIIAGIQVQSTTQKWYSNPAIDALIEKGRETLNPTARDKVYQDLYKALVEDAPYVYTHAQDNVWAKKASNDWSFEPFAGNLSMTLLHK